MLKSLAAMIRKVLAAVPRFAIEFVRIGGRLVARLVARPAPEVIGPDADVVAAASAGGDDNVGLAGIKRSAAAMAAGRDPSADELAGVVEQQLDWLRSLDDRGLAVVACAQLDQLRAHLRGRAPIKALVPYDVQAIRDVIESRRREREKAATIRAGEYRRRRLRDVLQEQGLPF